MSASGVRKAAAVLAGLNRRDQEWVLARLPLVARFKVRPLLARARALGATSEELVREAIDACERAEVAPEPPAPDYLLAGMQGMTPVWKARVLAACAPDHVELYAANHPAGDVQVVRNELLMLPKQLPPKLACALADFVKRRGESVKKDSHTERAS